MFLLAHMWSLNLHMRKLTSQHMQNEWKCRQVINFTFWVKGFIRCCVFVVFALSAFPRCCSCILQIKTVDSQWIQTVYARQPGMTSHTVLLMHFLLWKKSQLWKHQCREKCKVILIDLLLKCTNCDLDVNKRAAPPTTDNSQHKIVTDCHSQIGWQLLYCEN